MLLSSSCFAVRPVWLALAMTCLCGVAGEKLAAEQQQQQENVKSTASSSSSSSSLSRLSYCNMMGEVCYWRGAEDDHLLASHHAAIATWSPKNPEWVSAVLPSEEGVGCGCLKTKNPACSSRRGGGGGSSFMALMLSAQQEQEQEQEEERRLGRLLQTGKKSSSEGKKSPAPEPTEPGPAMCDTCCPLGTTQNPAGFPCLVTFYTGGIATLYSQGTFTCLGERRLACLTENSNSEFTLVFPASCVLPPTGTRKLTESDNEEQQAKRMTPMEKHLMAVGFVRIPKTGSTTLLYFFTRLVPDLFPWYDYLSEPQDDDDDEPIMPRQEQGAVVTKPQMIGAAASSCVYGRVPTTAHLGSNYHKNNNNAAGSSWNSCPHVPYPNLVKQWSRSLEHWVPPKTAVLEDNENDHSFGLRAFSMVRDPFDRLVSFFFYLQSFSDDKTEFLKNTVTEEQYIRVKAGDLYGWMELLHEQGGGCGLELPFQYKYIHQDLDTALSLIQQQEDEEGHVAPKIFVLLTECYELSLRLLVENFEDQFEGVSVDDFVASPEFESNKNKKSITNKDSYNKLDLDEQGLKSLRELAEVWFEEDFVFYDAAVKQFQNYMAQSKLDSALFGSCAV